MLWLLYLGLAATPLLAAVFKLIKIQIRNAKSPLRNLSGPPSPSWLFGNFKQIFERGQSVAWDEWAATYGKTYRFSTMLNVRLRFHNVFSWPHVSAF